MLAVADPVRRKGNAAEKMNDTIVNVCLFRNKHRCTLNSSVDANANADTDIRYSISISIKIEVASPSTISST